MLFRVVGRVSHETRKHTTHDAIGALNNNSIVPHVNKIFVNKSIPYFVHELTMKVSKKHLNGRFPIMQYCNIFLDFVGEL